MVYWPFKCDAGAKQMNHWLSPLFGSDVRAMPMVPRLERKLLGKLRRQILAAAAGARAGGVAGLRHEARDYPVKDDAVIEFLARQFLDPRDMLRRRLRIEFDDRTAVLQFQIEHILKLSGFLGVGGDGERHGQREGQGRSKKPPNGAADAADCRLRWRMGNHRRGIARRARHGQRTAAIRQGIPPQVVSCRPVRTSDGLCSGRTIAPTSASLAAWRAQICNRRQE